MRCCKPLTTKKSPGSTCDGSASTPVPCRSVTSCPGDSFLPGETLTAYFGADLQDIAKLHQPFDCCCCLAYNYKECTPVASNTILSCSCCKLAHYMAWLCNQVLCLSTGVIRTQLTHSMHSSRSSILHPRRQKLTRQVACAPLVSFHWVGQDTAYTEQAQQQVEHCVWPRRHKLTRQVACAAIVVSLYWVG